MSLHPPELPEQKPTESRRLVTLSLASGMGSGSVYVEVGHLPGVHCLPISSRASHQWKVQVPRVMIDMKDTTVVRRVSSILSGTNRPNCN